MSKTRGGGPQMAGLMACIVLGAGPALAQSREPASAPGGPDTNARDPSGPEPAKTDIINPLGRDLLMQLPVAVGGRLLADVPVVLTADQRILVEASGLGAVLGESLSETGLAKLRLAIAGASLIDVDALAASGFPMRYDQSEQMLVLELADPALLRSGRVDFGAGAVDAPLGSAPEAVAAYLNVGATVRYTNGDGEQGFDPEFDFLAAVRAAGVVAEVDGAVQEALDDSQGDAVEFVRRGARLVYDSYKDKRRIVIGDVAPLRFGLQDPTILGGVSIARGERVFGGGRGGAVRIDRRSVFLQRDAEVEIYVNGALARRLRAPAGEFDIDNLPAQFGTTRIEVVVRDDLGRVQRFDFSAFVDPSGLSAGEYEYGLSAGLIANMVTQGLDYSETIGASGFYRRAFSGGQVAGLGLQASNDLQAITGELRFGSLLGPTELQVAASQSEETGYAAALSFSRPLQGPKAAVSHSIGFSVDYRSANFRSLGADDNALSGRQFNLSAGYAAQFGQDWGFSANAFYTDDAFSGQRTTLAAEVSRRLARDVRVRAGLEYQDEADDDTALGVRVGLAWAPSRGERVDVRHEGVRDLSAVRFAHGGDDAVGALSYDVGYQKAQTGSNASGSATYLGNRFEARLSQSLDGPELESVVERSVSTVRLSSSLAYAGGAVGVGRPIGDSFALVRGHKTLKGAAVLAGRDQVESDNYAARTGLFGPALLPRLASYANQNLQLSVDGAQPGYDVGPGVETLFPAYRSGYLIEVGTDRFISATGSLRMADGAQAALVSGVVRGLDDAGFEEQPFFTNQAGRFAIIGLAPGRTYRIALNGGLGAFDIKIPEGEAALHALGVVSLSDGV